MATNPVPTTALSLLLLLGLDQSGHALDSYAFPARDGAALSGLRNSVERAMVRVYESSDGDDFVGSATILDSEFGLAITAAHVAGFDVGAGVWLAASGDSKRYRAEIVALVPPLSSRPGAAAASSGQPRDIAILRLGEPGAFGSYAEIRLAGAVHNHPYQLAGYGPNDRFPVWGGGIAAKSGDECWYVLREATFGGDSGGAVIGEDGLLSGVILSGKAAQGAASGMQGMVFQPLSCLTDTILAATPDVGDSGKTAIDVLLTGTEQRLLQYFQPTDQRPANWISNLRLAKAIKTWLESRKKSATRTTIPEDRGVLVLDILKDRGIGSRIAFDIVVANAGPTETGDTLQRFGDTLVATGREDDGIDAYRLAMSAYVEQTSVPGQDAGLAAGKAYRSAADSATKIANLTGAVGDFRTAAILAANSVSLLPDGPLKGSAVAAFAYASQRAGNLKYAVPAYDYAVKLGFNKPWVTESSRFAVEMLGTDNTVHLDDDVFAGIAGGALKFRGAFGDPSRGTFVRRPGRAAW